MTRSRSLTWATPATMIAGVTQPTMAATTCWSARGRACPKPGTPFSSKTEARLLPEDEWFEFDMISSCIFLPRQQTPRLLYFAATNAAAVVFRGSKRRSYVFCGSNTASVIAAAGTANLRKTGAAAFLLYFTQSSWKLQRIFMKYTFFA